MAAINNTYGHKCSKTAAYVIERSILLMLAELYNRHLHIKQLTNRQLRDHYNTADDRSVGH